MTSSSDRIAALQRALAANPEDHDLRLLLADLLQHMTGCRRDACDEYERLLSIGHLPAEELVSVGLLALEEDRLEMAGKCLAKALESGVLQGTAGLQAKLDERLAEKGMIRVVLPAGSRSSSAVGIEREAPITFAQVGGLEAVKKRIHRMILLPMQRPDLYRRYGRQAGGGVLLYGPPGCGKTLLARATAGECSLPFLNVRIEDVLDKWFGMSEKRLHGVFEFARGQAPCVLFLDEIDALGYNRRKQEQGPGRTLVDQLLQELDAIGAENSELLILAATNAPWDVDDALLRPGRFDRRVFVPPPDEAARLQILRLYLLGLPAGPLDLNQLVARTCLYSGADLRALVQGAADEVIDEALTAGTELPLTMSHLLSSLAMLRPTTIDWLLSARNYVEFGNQDGRYDEVLALLGTREVQSQLKHRK